MMRDAGRAPGGRLIVLLGVAAVIGIATLLGFGYRATRGWQRSSMLLKERDTAEATDLLLKALGRDMAGMQSRVLASGDWTESMLSLADTSTQISIAFTRYPYPESFFSWRDADPGVVFFNRTDRVPQWMPDNRGAHRFPVFLVFDPPGAHELRSRINAYGTGRYRYVVFDTIFGDEPYQVVARLLYSDPARERPDAVVGFTVNLRWIRQSYFADLVSQIVRVANREGGLQIDVFDERGDLVSGTGTTSPQTRRQFPLLFADPTFEKLAAPAPRELQTWAVQIAQTEASPVNVLAHGADEALKVAAAAGLMLCLSLVLAIKSVRSEVALATMRSDFVSSVTHELKMPLANISLMADSLALRPAAAEKIQRYAGLLRQESRRLSQLIDNLLAYARITDVAQVYSFEPLQVPDLLETVLQSFQHPLSEQQFSVDVDVPRDLPPVRADRPAMVLALGNLIDNAVRYSTDRRELTIRARSNGSRVTIDVQDCGAGIPPGELPIVAGKFVRVKRTRLHGSGLGLAIVARVVADHRGTFELDSAPGRGTLARLTLPSAEAVS
jgi:two-component system phosphate regulon sensor histidine kinase PhoR